MSELRRPEPGTDPVYRLEEMGKYLDSMSFINRYALWHRIKDMNVAEHSFRVAVLAMCIADIHRRDYPSTIVDTEWLLRKALLHDTPEVKEGDIPYSVKHRDGDTEEFFGNLERRLASAEILKENEQYRKYVLGSKDGEEGRIITIADMLDIVLYTQREVMLGNLKMAPLMYKAADYLREMTNNTPYGFVANFIDSIIHHVEFIHHETLERYVASLTREDYDV
jgi:5'-deoxynucleotidase